MRRLAFALAAIAFLCTVSFTQDSPSLGDVARQARAQKQQKDAQAKDAAQKDNPGKDASGKDSPGNDAQNADSDAKSAAEPKTSHVITNEELPEHTSSVAPSRHHSNSSVPEPSMSPADHEAEGERWKSQIQEQKNSLAEYQREIDNLSNSIRYAPANCVSNCAQWNERQQQKQGQLESMKAQLEEQQRRLEDMQEAARKEGFGSSVYDP